MLDKVIIFSAGALVGGLSAFFVTKAVMVKKFNNDLNDVRDYYRAKEGKTKEPEPEKKEEKVEKKQIFQTSSIDMDRYKEKVTSHSYGKYESAELGEPTKPDISEGPIVVKPKDFYAGEEDGTYETTELIFYEDDEILADHNDEIVATTVDIDDLLGTGNIDRYGEYEADMLYVRLPKLPNEDKGTQYMISVIHDSYERVTGMAIEEP